MAPPLPLPIDDHLAAIVAAVRARGVAVVRAETGAGKTTRVAPALLQAGLAGGKQLLLLEPRRIAARAAARRIAEELGATLGEEVGYQVRLERCAGPRTQLLVVTEGIVLRMLQDDPFLEQVGLIVFDEFHERSLDADLALALATKVRRDARPDLKLVVMSATLDAEPIVRFLGDGDGGAPLQDVPGRTFPVALEWRPMKRDDRLEEAVAAAVREALRDGGGDVLVFLPGRGEIARCARVLQPELAARAIETIELHGELSAERQDAALRPGAGRRVILATNVAETSVTLPRVTAVVDSGLVRRLQLDPATGLDRLELGRVSQASAEQRRGRAGRVAPGRCIRLWSALDHRGLPDHETPEIARVDLAGLALQLLSFGERDLDRFPFFAPPPQVALDHALAQLERLGATQRGALTAIGRRMAQLPAAPRLARLLVEGERLAIAPRAALAAALLAEREPFHRDPRQPALHESDSDVVDRVAALEEHFARGTSRFECGDLERGRADLVRRAADQLLRALRTSAEPARRSTELPDPARPDLERDPDRALRRALFVAWADRLAKRREAGSPRALLTGGRGVRLAEESAVRRADLFVAIDLDDSKSDEARVRRASAVEREWLDDPVLGSAGVTVADEVRFDRERECVVARRVMRCGDLVIEEKQLGLHGLDRTADPDGDAIARTLAAAAATEPARALGLAREELQGYLQRVRRLAEWMPELELPRFDEPFWRDWLPELCAGSKSFAELQRLPLLELLRGKLGARLARAVEQHAPERLVVPSGSAIRLDYPSEGPPILAARLQELFGWGETPRLANGRVAVVLHLLAPNHRPQQVTQDLASFWNSVYPKIRGELRARYPRHSWPDDPWNAPAVRGPVRRRSS